MTHGTGHPPTIKINKYDDKIHEGASVNITATIKSGPPILSLKWEVLGGNLPPNTKTILTMMAQHCIVHLSWGAYAIVILVTTPSLLVMKMELQENLQHFKFIKVCD